MTEAPKLTLQEALTAHWQAKYALEVAKQAEADAKQVLADMLCAEDDGYKNKTMTFQDGTKMKLEVARTIKGKKDDPRIIAIRDVHPDIYGLLVRTKEVTEFSLSAYLKMPAAAKSVIGNAVTIHESVSIKYEQPQEQR